MNYNAKISRIQGSTKSPIMRWLTIEWIVFLFIWPFGTLVGALRNFRSPQAKTVFWMFCIYFGFTFIYGDPFSIGGSDSTRYAADLINAHKHSNTFGYMLQFLYDPDYGITDIYQPIATWVVASFTDDPRWLFMLFAAVFGFFYAQNLWFIYSQIDKDQKINLLLFIFLLGYALVLPIWMINGVRMWTATHVFIYGIYLYTFNNNKNGFFWIFSSALFHFSFFFPIALVLLFRFVPKKLSILLIFFFATTLVSEINLNLVRENLLFLPDVFQYKVEAYTNENYALSVTSESQKLAWHVRYSTTGGKWILFFWIFMLYFYRRTWVNQLPKAETLFSLALFLGGFAQIASLVPSGFRYIVIVRLLFYGIIILALTQKAFYNKMKWYNFITIPLLGFYLVFLIRVGFEYMGINTLFGNPILAVIFSEQTPLINFVKDLF